MSEISKLHINEFEKICNRLNKLMDKIVKYCPQANYYLANDTLNLMKGPSHTSSINQEVIYENVVACHRIEKSGGGDW